MPPGVVSFVICFNSILVRLKEVGYCANSIKQNCFNSILVRLKAKLRKVGSASIKFQFHSGTIKSAGAPVASSATGSVSIPFWYD